MKKKLKLDRVNKKVMSSMAKNIRHTDAKRKKNFYFVVAVLEQFFHFFELVQKSFQLFKPDWQI